MPRYRIPALTLGERQFLRHLEQLVETHKTLLGERVGIRIAYKLNEQRELVLAVIIPGIRPDA